MSQFDQYFQMRPADVAAYARERLDIFPPDADLAAAEIGDGNINYIFRVWDRKTNQSIIVKQAGPVARISDAFVLSTDRIRIESEILALEAKLAPGLVPVMHYYDPIMSCCVMEDLSDHAIMRQALVEHQTFPRFADDITTFMVNTLLLTTDVVMEHKAKKTRAKSFVNPELCEITEDLVYTEPFNNYRNRNDVFPPNLEWVTANLYQDAALRLEAAKLKFEFMTNAQALIHGDLHTGSIFIKPDSTKVIDPEFAFYGPIGYDTGNIVANLIFAWVNGDATIASPAQRADYLEWIESAIVAVVDLFRAKFQAAWQTHATEVFAREPGFSDWYLATVLRDTAGVTGLELCRRIVGIAHVKDITSIANPTARVRAERICLTAAKRYIKQRDQYQNGAAFVATLHETVAQFPKP